ncbi:MAG: TIGR04149 family rSAM-modified RiPP [Prevotellaceae bacterium]|nr:TIGR04149 family rSAM-modified RiPP [Prevotellaceae bacterium]
MNKIKITDMNKIKLNKLAQNAMKNKEMNHVRGGFGNPYFCGCGCQYAGQGGSSTTANASANSAYGMWPGGGASVKLIVPSQFS